MAKKNPLARVFNLYTSDLNFQEIEKLIKKEAAGVYEYFANDIPKPSRKKNRLTGALVFARSLFNAFLMKMPAARRFFYLIGLLIFFVGIMQASWTYIIIAFIIVNLLLAFELADKLTAKSEIELAREIQSSLLPTEIPENKFYEISTFYRPAQEVGGDYLDVIPREGDKSTFVFIGDISGKGIPAALYVVRVQAILHALLKNYAGLREILINLKNYFSDKLKRQYFLTAVAACIHEDGTIKLANAGHNPVFHYKKDANKLEKINPKGLGIGFNDKGMFEKTLEEQAVNLDKGDILFLYTDGIPDAMNNYKIQFGESKMVKVLEANSDKSAEEIKKAFIKELENFQMDAEQNDDWTMIVIKKTN